MSFLRATADKIGALTVGFADADLRRRNSADEFSLVENVCHLRDIEIEGYTTRINRILNEDRPILADIDGGRLAIQREYSRQDFNEALHAFAQARTENIRILNTLGPDELSREGTLEGVGIVKLGELLMMMRDHDASHLEDIELIRRRLTAHPSHSAA